VAAIAGFGPATARVVLDGEHLDAATTAERHRAQLCVATCRVDELPTLKVADFVVLGLRAPEPPLWKTLLGTSQARAMSADDQAQVRALAGRTGLAAWVDRPVVELPDLVIALMDVTRALAGLPKALVWRRPDWLAPEDIEHVRDAIEHERATTPFSVVEFTASSAAAGP
jgi:ABC-type branched-subunit amino acid transport system ATPase component